MKQLSKSKYAKYCQCPKCLWMSVYKPEEEVIDPSAEGRFEKGTEVGNLAKGVLGPYVDVTVKRGDGSLDLSAMIQNTKNLIAESKTIYVKLHSLSKATTVLWIYFTAQSMDMPSMK